MLRSNPSWSLWSSYISLWREGSPGVRSVREYVVDPRTSRGKNAECLLRPERLQRIDRRCLARGQVTREHGGQQEDRHNRGIGHGVPGTYAEQQRSEQSRKSRRRSPSDRDAYDRQRQAPPHKHPLDIPFGGAERKSNSRLTPSLGSGIGNNSVNADDSH